VSLWVGLVLAGQLVVAGATGAALVAGYVVYKRRRGAERTRACAECEELGREGVCSGYAQQAESIRAYSQCLEEFLNRESGVPAAIRPLVPRADGSHPARVSPGSRFTGRLDEGSTGRPKREPGG
jgi:hypothetical protein